MKISTDYFTIPLSRGVRWEGYKLLSYFTIWPLVLWESGVHHVVRSLGELGWGGRKLRQTKAHPRFLNTFQCKVLVYNCPRSALI